MKVITEIKEIVKKTTFSEKLKELHREKVNVELSLAEILILAKICSRIAGSPTLSLRSYTDDMGQAAKEALDAREDLWKILYCTGAGEPFFESSSLMAKEFDGQAMKW